MRLIDAEKLRDVIDNTPSANILLQQLNKEDVIRAILDAPTVAMGTDHVMINWTPDIDKLARDVAFRGLNEFSYMGKSIREWVDIILEQYAMKKQSEWVSVEDRLPDRYGPYLVCMAGTSIDWLSMAVRYWMGGVDGDYWHGVEAGSRITGITHWRALPEPPKDEIEEALDE